MPVPIVGQRLVGWKYMLRMLFGPTDPLILIRVIFQIKLKVLLTAAAEDIDVTRNAWIFGRHGSGFAQNFLPEHLVELPVTEMIGS